MQLPKVFRELLALLNARRVKYIVVGGYAVAYHGYARATQDMDVFIELTRRNALALMRALDDFGFSTAGLAPEFFLDEKEVVWIGREPNKLDILNSIAGVSFAACYRQRERAWIDGVRVNFISLPDLLANKRAAARHKDLADIEQLEKAEAQPKPRPPRRKKSPPGH